MLASKNYQIFPELNLIIECYFGNTTVNDIIEQRKSVITDKDYKTHYNTMLDFRESFLNFDINELEDIFDFIKKNVYLENNKCAFVTSTPDHVVKAHIFKTRCKSLPIHYEIYSTIKHAINYLSVGIDNLFVDKVLTKLHKPMTYEMSV
jgi:hypothetical protein